MLILKHVPIKSFNEKIVYLHKNCSVYQMDDISALTKVEIMGGAKPVYGFLQIVDDESVLSPDEIGLNTEAFESINLPEGSNISLSLPPSPHSLGSIKRKIAGNILSPAEYSNIINDITTERYSNIDIASFLVASGAFMTPQEVLSYTQALIGVDTLHWDNESIVVDHHCIGGVPGNKTDIILTAIVAAYGLPIPKTVSHSLTSSAGVADTMSVLANVNLDLNDILSIVKENRGVLASHRNLNLIPAAHKISLVEQQIELTQPQHLVSSILAIKMAMGVTHLLLDIPVGPNSRIKNTREALQIRKLAEYVGDQIGLEVEAVVTDGSEPIGNGVGAVLEARDVMKVLKNKDDAPQDLREKSLFLAGRILEFDPKLRGGQGYFVAKELLDSGQALEAFNKIIHAQGKAPQPVLGSMVREISSPVSGVIKAIDNARINKISVLAGAIQNPGAGLDLLKKVGDTVEEGEALFRIHSMAQSEFEYACNAAEGNNGYTIE